MSSTNDQVIEYCELAVDLKAGTQLMREVMEENQRKHIRYRNLIKSSDLTTEEMTQANQLRIEGNEELEELRALRKDLLGMRERMDELDRLLEDADAKDQSCRCL